VKRTFASPAGNYPQKQTTKPEAGWVLVLGQSSITPNVEQRGQRTYRRSRREYKKVYDTRSGAYSFRSLVRAQILLP
jgi:hypothetical protein